MSDIDKVLETCKTVAVVGLSPRPDRDSNWVAQYIQEHGYRIIPVNPAAQEILGEKCYPDLASIPEPVDVVDIFRRSEEVPTIVADAIKIGARAVWMQKGVVSEEGASAARNAGLTVVMDECIECEVRVRAGGLAEDEKSSATSVG